MNEDDDDEEEDEDCCCWVCDEDEGPADMYKKVFVVFLKIEYLKSLFEKTERERTLLIEIKNFVVKLNCHLRPLVYFYFIPNGFFIFHVRSLKKNKTRKKKRKC